MVLRLQCSSDQGKTVFNLPKWSHWGCSRHTMLSLEHAFYFPQNDRSLPINFDSQENPLREMVLFCWHIPEPELSYSDSGDLTETLTSTFEIIAERTQGAPSSSEPLALLAANHQFTSPWFHQDSQQSGIKSWPYFWDQNQYLKHSLIHALEMSW